MSALVIGPTELDYLQHILTRLRLLQQILPDEERTSLGGEALADEIEWLDSFIAARLRAAMTK